MGPPEGVVLCNYLFWIVFAILCLYALELLLCFYLIITASSQKTISYTYLNLDNMCSISCLRSRAICVGFMLIYSLFHIYSEYNDLFLFFVTIVSVSGQYQYQ
jgi:hypothetical protein